MQNVYFMVLYCKLNSTTIYTYFTDVSAVLDELPSGPFTLSTGRIVFLLSIYFCWWWRHIYILPSYMKERQKRKLETGTSLFSFLISGAADKLSSYIDECV
jgi:hypothetical protein